jgi:serine/threonine-protein kinase
LSTGSHKPRRPGAPDTPARSRAASDSYAHEPTHVAPAPAQPDASVDPFIGRVVSERYRILRKLGEGGMGIVYLAEHIVIEKKVALKVLSDDLAKKGDLVTRFMQEAKAASRIGHENIVDITDFGQTDSGSVFIAMEYLEGADLATVIREQGPLPFARAQSIMNQICRGLGAAHSKGIIHRDMKPENIFLIEREGRADFVKILDFGIAKMSSMDEANERLTRTGMIFGTPEYMSPEQARGERPDHRVDIYAAGCILYEMLTGDVPFHAETFMGVLTKHMFESPEAPSLRAPAANITAEVEAVVMNALAKNRDERYRSMRQFALALAACNGVDATSEWGQESSGVFQSSSPVSASASNARTIADATAFTVEPPARSRTWLWSVALACTVLGAATFVLWPSKPPPTPPLGPVPVVVSPVAHVEPPSPEPLPEKHPDRQVFTMNIEPRDALVLVNDEVLHPIGPANRYALPWGHQHVSISVRKAGFVDGITGFTPDHDGTVVKKLERVPAHKPSGGSVHKASTTEPRVPVETPPAPEPKLEPVKPVPTKSQSGDLMDPFAGNKPH